jgi:hypothetical protein
MPYLLHVFYPALVYQYDEHVEGFENRIFLYSTEELCLQRLRKIFLEISIYFLNHKNEMDSFYQSLYDEDLLDFFEECEDRTWKFSSKKPVSELPVDIMYKILREHFVDAFSKCPIDLEYKITDVTVLDFEDESFSAEIQM